MDVLAKLAPHGPREEWFLEAIGILLVLLLGAVAWLGSPRARRVRLRALLGFLALNIATFVGAELTTAKPVRSVASGLAIVFMALALARGTFLLGFDVLIARNRAVPLPRIVRDMSQGAVVLIAALISLPAAGVNPGQILTTSALLTVVAGMALQETLGNLVAGLAIQTERPFEVGDWIEVHGTPGHIGRVREINWRATRLHTLDNVDVVVPNGLLAKATFTNYDRPHQAARRSVYFSVPYGVPPRKVHEIVMPSLEDTPGVLATPEPSLVTFNFGESGVQYWLRFYIDEMARRDAIDGAVRDRVWYSLARAGLGLALPGRMVTVEHATIELGTLKAQQAADDRRSALASTELFSMLPPDELTRLAERTRTAMFAPGEVVIRQGERGGAMYVVRRGELAVRIGRPGTVEVEVAHLQAGGFFGEMSLLTGDPRRASVVAVSATELLVIDHDAFRDLAAANEAVVQMIGAKVAQRNVELASNRTGLSLPPTQNTEPPDALVDRIRRFFGLSRS